MLTLPKRKSRKSLNNWEHYKKGYPSNISEGDDISFLTKTAQDINMKGVTVAFEGKENKGPYTIKKYNLQASGTYLQYLILLEKISEFERLINVQSILLEIPSDKTRSRYQLINTRNYY